MRPVAPAMVITLCVFSLSGCDGASSINPIASREREAPQLWAADVLGPSGAVYKSVRVCADSRLLEGFSRAEPAVNGEPCRAEGDVVDKPGLYALRCRIPGHRFAAVVTTRGDAARDFTVRYALTPLDSKRTAFVQTVHYRLLGPCPAKWK